MIWGRSMNSWTYVYAYSLSQRMKWLNERCRNWGAQSCKQLVPCLCDCQRDAVINKPCDSSYRHHLPRHRHTHVHAYTHIQTHSSDHGIPLGYKSPGRTCVQLQHPSCFPFFPSCLFSSLQVLLIQVSYPPFLYSLYILVNSFTTHASLSPSVFPSPPQATFFTVPDLFRVWHAVKSLWRWMCVVQLSLLSHCMMESLAYLWYGSSCFAVCLMYSGPLESNQYATGEQIAVKPLHTLCHLTTWPYMEPSIQACTGA